MFVSKWTECIVRFSWEQTTGAVSRSSQQKLQCLRASLQSDWRQYFIFSLNVHFGCRRFLASSIVRYGTVRCAMSHTRTQIYFIHFGNISSLYFVARVCRLCLTTSTTTTNSAMPVEVRSKRKTAYCFEKCKDVEPKVTGRPERFLSRCRSSEANTQRKCCLAMQTVSRYIICTKILSASLFSIVSLLVCTAKPKNQWHFHWNSCFVVRCSTRLPSVRLHSDGVALIYPTHTHENNTIFVDNK